MSSNFIFIYDLNTNILFKNDIKLNIINHKTCSGDILTFKVTNSGLELCIPFFLLDNIFYFQSNDIIYFSNNIENFNSLTSVDSNANKFINQYGFLPLSSTQLVGVKIICSYLKYKFSKNENSIQSCYPEIELNFSPTVDDLMECLKLAFRKQIDKINSENFILPLSGGMDSRLLLELSLEVKDINLNLFTLGTERSGDVILARKIVQSLGLEKKHKVFNIENLTKKQLMDNYLASGYLLPLDRLLNIPLGNFYPASTVISGLYGDIIFADNKSEQINFSEYLASENFVVHNDDDLKIVESYNNLPHFSKLQRTLFRCQKLTRLSLVLSPGFEFITPFVDPNVITIASSIKSQSIYPTLINKFMRPSLKKIIHQSTLSYFNHPNYLRYIERKIFKLLRHPARLPYFDNLYLKNMGIVPNQAPPLE